jgi:endo-1,4-beta-xylanase
MGQWLCLALLLLVISVVGADAQEPAGGLRDLAARHGLVVGTAVSPAGLDDAAYLALVERHFALVVPEYGMYMSQLRPAPDAWDFTQADAVLAFAAERGLAVRGHALVWGMPLDSANPFGGWTPIPAWLHRADISRDAAIEIMQDHIETVMRRYGGQVRDWVVVNETLSGTTLWDELIGPDYVALAFRHARRVDAGARLMLNDWGADYRGQGARVDAYYDLVVRLLGKGAPIDAVGFQFHLLTGHDQPSVADIAANLARFRALGVSTHITELDVRIRAPVTEEKLAAQAHLYETVFRAAADGADIVLWGFTDRYFWIPETFPDHPVGTLMDSALNPWPAFEAARGALD